MTEALDRSYAELLARIELFVGVDRVALAQLAAYLESLTLSDGVTLCHKGDEGDALYIVAEGILEVVIPGEDDKGETRLNVLSTGDYLGEMALITGEPRSATVRARGHARVLRLARERFLHLLETEPSVGRSVIRVLSQRLRASDRARQQSDLAFKGTVEGVLAAFPSDERACLLLTSVLASRSGAVLEAVFGDRSQEVAANLAKLAVGLPEPSPACLQILRERLDQEVAAEEIEGFLSSAGAQLADACLWNDALSVLAQSEDRGGFVAALASALRAVPPVDQDTARQWTEQLTDREAATEPLVALLAAERYEERGQRVAALQVLQQAVEAALAVGDTGAVHKLTEAVSGLTALEESRPRLRRRAAVGRLPGAGWAAHPAAALAIAGALACLAAAGVLAREHPQWAFLLLLGSALALWNSNIVPDFAVSLALVGAWMIFGIARAEDAVAGFATMDWLFVLAVLGIAVAVARSGLLFRAGLLLVQRSPARLAPQALALMATGLLLSPLLPEPRGRAALTSPLALAVAEACRLRDREPAAALLGLAAWIGAGPLMFVFLNASPVCLLAWGLLPPEDRVRFDWLTWFAAALPFGLVIAVGMFGALFLLLRPNLEALPSRERLSLQLAVLGPVSPREHAIIVVLALSVVGWFVAPALGVHVGVVAVLGFFAAAATGSFDQQSFREMDWDFLIYYGVALSMQRLSATLGLGGAAGELLGAGSPAGGSLFLLAHPLVFLAIVAIAGFLTRLFLEASQAVLLLSLAFFPAAAVVGVSPWLVAIALLATNNPWFTEKQTPAYQLAYVGSGGRLYSHAQARGAALAYAGITLAGLLLLTPYWRLIGLL